MSVVPLHKCWTLLKCKEANLSLDEWTLASRPAIKSTICLQDECYKMTLSNNPLKVIRSTLPLGMQLASNFSLQKCVYIHEMCVSTGKALYFHNFKVLEYQNKLPKVHSDT
jgi:hypothetical protein